MSETASDDSHDFILPVDDVPPLLAPLNEARLKKVATTNCYVGTTDGAASEPPVTAIKNASIQLGEDAAYYLYTGLVFFLHNMSFAESCHTSCTGESV